MPDGGLSLAGWLAVAGAALFLGYRGAGFAASLGIWIEERFRGPHELYGDRRAAGGVDEIGTARTDLAPRGKVFVRGELWDAVAETAVPAGERVEVVGAEGLVLQVRGADPHGAPGEDSSMTTRGG